MNTDQTQSRDPDESLSLGQVVLRLCTGRRLVVAALLVCGVAYLIFRGTPALGFVLGRLRDVSVTLVLAVVVAYVVTPIVDAFCAFRPFAGGRLGRAAATLVTFILLAVGLVCLLVLTADPIIQETQRLVQEGETWLKDAPSNLRRLMEAYTAAVPPELENLLVARTQNLASSVLDYAGVIALGAVLRGWYLVEALLVPVLAFYFVTDADQLRAGFLRVIPEKYHARLLVFTKDVNKTLEGYIRGQLILCLIAAVVTSTVLYLLHVNVFLTLGILAGLARAVPVIGPVVIAVPIVAITWIQADARAAGIALVVFIAMHLIESKIVMPKLIGWESALHPVVVIVALLIGGEFFGILGMFVAVPIAAALRVAFLHWKAGQTQVQAASA